MTNAGDFRRYSYANDTNYALQAFNAKRNNTATAPAQPKPRERFVVHENKVVKSAIELKREQKRAFQSSLKIMLSCVVCLTIVATVISTFAIKNQLTRELASTQKQISNAQSECISLKSQLNSMVSMSMVEQYAVEELGMNKVKPNKVLYIDVDQYKADRQAMLAQQEQEQLSNKTE